MDTLSNGCHLRIFSQVLLAALLALLLAQASLAEIEDVERFCSKRDDGMYSHPWDCRRFIKCYAGLTYVQQCSPELFFNPKIGVCDRPEQVNCKLPEIKVTEIPIVTTEELMTSYFGDDDDHTLETLHDAPATSRAPLHDVIQNTGTPLHDVTDQTIRWETTGGNRFMATTENPGTTKQPLESDDVTLSAKNLYYSSSEEDSESDNYDTVQRNKYLMAKQMKYAQKIGNWEDEALLTNQILDDGHYYKSPKYSKPVNYSPYSEMLAKETYRQSPNSYQGTSSANKESPRYATYEVYKDNNNQDYNHKPKQYATTHNREQDNYRQNSDNYRQNTDNYRPSNNDDRQVRNSYRPSNDNYRQNTNNYRQSNNNYRQDSNNYRQSNDNHRQNSNDGYRQNNYERERYPQRETYRRDNNAGNEQHNTDRYTRYNSEQKRNNTKSYDNNQHNNRDDNKDDRYDSRESNKDYNYRDYENDNRNDDRNDNRNGNRNQDNKSNERSDQQNQDRDDDGNNNNYDYQDYQPEEQQPDDNQDQQQPQNNQQQQSPNGKHSSQGRKPPKFENFPNNFLPGHLTGPRFGGDNFFGPKVGVPQFDEARHLVESTTPGLQFAGEKRVMKQAAEVLKDDKKHVSTESPSGSSLVTEVVSETTQSTPTSTKTSKTTTKHTVHTVHTPLPTNNYTLLKLYRFKRDLSEGTTTPASVDPPAPASKPAPKKKPQSFQKIHASMFKNKKAKSDPPISAPDEYLRFASLVEEVQSKNDIMLQNDSIAVHHPKFNDYHHSDIHHDSHVPHVEQYDSRHIKYPAPPRDLDVGPPPHIDLDERSGDYYGPHSSNDIFAYMHRAMDDAKHHIERRLHNEARMVHQMSYTTDSVPFKFVAAFLATKPYAKYLSHSGLYMTDFLKLMSDKYELPAREIVSKFNMKSNRHILKPLPKIIDSDFPMPIPPDIDYCPYPRFHCDVERPYRTFDGSCNNLKYPILGRSMTPHRRLLPAHYANGVDSFRTSAADGSPLPGARQVSFNLFRDRNRPNRLNTLLLMIWGQFVDHDLTRTALVEMIKEDERYFGETEELKCGFDGCVTGLPGIEECKPIPIPHDDYDFRFNRCIKFVRSAPVPPLNCKPGNREQLNQVTTWLDGSMIYGSNKQENDDLRDFFEPYRGRMAVTPHPYNSYLKPLLPQDDVDTCRDTNFTVRCFRAGDERVNEQVALTSMHTIWVREHNRIESILHKLNPHWGGERLFQETRRIVIAQIQHIVFNEHLTLILGPRVVKEYGLVLQDYGYYKGYDPNIDPRIANEFSAAAFRFGHTLIQDRFRRTSHNFRPDDSLMLSSAFRRPPPIYEVRNGPGVDLLIRGLVDFPAQSYDRFFTKQITVSLFSERPPFGPGMDLLSLNIQRARDHGLQSYNYYREFCGMKRAYNFDDLYQEIPSRRSISLLRKIYKSVDDIDLFTGGVYEDSVEGGVVGPTFACVIANQFRAARRGDRFFYENDHKYGFSPDQLQAIRRGTRLARVLCTNSDEIDSIQPWALLHPFRDAYPDLSDDAYDDRDTGIPFNSFSKKHGKNFNRRTSCRSLPDIDFKKWQEK